MYNMKNDETSFGRDREEYVLLFLIKTENSDKFLWWLLAMCIKSFKMFL